MALELPRGTRDYGPKESIRLKSIISRVEETFKRFGFYPIITPAIEKTDVLSSKIYGSSANNEIFLLEDKESGLRYDLTVPTARYIAMNKGTPLPLKRYAIGNAWRRDEPQFLRLREFMQADIDVIGSTELISEAEVIAATAVALEEIGIADYAILINNRALISAIMDRFSIPKEKHVQAMRILDKLAKTSTEEIIRQLSESGIANDTSEQLLNFINVQESNDEKLARISANIESAKATVGQLEKLLSILKQYKLKGNIQVDISVIRGLDYYTGTIWEFVTSSSGKRSPSIASGGRYDNLIEKYSRVQTPAVGSSIGVSRIADLIESKSSPKTYTNVYVSYIGNDALDYAIGVANTMRSNGICADLNVTQRNISKQLEYVNSLEIKYVCIVGPAELQEKKVKLRNMYKNEEESMPIEQAIARIKAGE